MELEHHLLLEIIHLIIKRFIIIMIIILNYTLEHL